MHKKGIEIPDELFALMAALYPSMVRLLEECELTLNDFCFLLYIRHFGREHDNGGTAILRSELGKIFDPILTPAGVTSRIETLEKKNLVHRGRLKEAEKVKMFGLRGGPKSIVFISEDGLNNLETFNRRINELFLGITGNVRKTAVRSFLGVVKRMAKGGLALVEARRRRPRFSL